MQLITAEPEDRVTWLSVNPSPDSGRTFTVLVVAAFVVASVAFQAL